MASGAGTQPKLRSTCNACITAKIRCSHESPKCFRCQLYKIDCVYGVSRRMGRPRKRRAASQGEQEQNKDAAWNANETPKEILQPESQTPAAPTAQQDTALPLATSDQQPVQKEKESSTPVSPSAMPMASEHPPLTMDDNFTATPYHSLDTMIPPLHDNICVMSRPRVLDTCSRAPSINEPRSPMDTSLGALFANRPHDTNLQVQGQSSSTGATNVRFDGQSLLRGGDKTHDILSIESEPSFFGSFVDFDTLDFSKFSGDFDNHASFEPSSPNLDRHPPPSYPESPSNQVSCQVFKPIDLNSSCCECYRSTLRVLLLLDETLPDTTSTTLDTALKIDKDVLAHVAKALRCTVCTDSRSKQLLLQAILVDRVVAIFESKPSNSTRITPSQSCSNLKRLAGTHHTHKSSTFVRLCGSMGISQNEINILASAENCALHVGGYEILEEKNRFIKQLLQMRLMSLMATLRSLQTATQSVRQDSSAKLAGMLLAESELRLRSVVGRVELWDV